jgi:hypothetical protein
VSLGWEHSIRLTGEHHVEVKRGALAACAIRLQRTVNAFFLLLIVDVKAHPEVQDWTVSYHPLDAF